jgi:hypothetical protein
MLGINYYNGRKEEKRTKMNMMGVETAVRTTYLPAGQWINRNE